MDPTRVKELLESVRAGRTGVDEAVDALGSWPTVDLGHTRLDAQRGLRCGMGEVVFAAGKSERELIEILEVRLEQSERVLATRVEPAVAFSLDARFPEGRYHERSRLWTRGLPAADAGEGDVLIVSAGTSDGAVAEEALLTARLRGARATWIPDCGVAGLQRLLAEAERLQRARALVVVAGMEGALPSVVAGLVSAPVIAVPTSVGYGANLGGIAALLTMLNSCAAGVTVVNIDNGFGAGYAAAQINALSTETVP